MSADNYVVVSPDDKNGYKFEVFSASDHQDPPIPYSSQGGFKTPKLAKEGAIKDTGGIIEYGIEFTEECLKGE